MIIANLPSASDLRAESRLLPAQVSPLLANNEALFYDIEGRLSTQKAFVQNRIIGVGDSPDNQLVATEAVSNRVLWSLYRSAGQLNAAYYARAENYRDEAESLINSLLALPGDDVGVPGSGGGAIEGPPAFSLTARRVDGYSQPFGDEYSR